MQRKIFTPSFLILLLLTFYSFSQEKINSIQLQNSTVGLYEKAEFDISASASFQNPFDASDIALDLILTSSGKTLVLPCFYISGDSDGSMWKGRFTPQESGSYQYKLRISRNGEEKASSDSYNFTVAPTAKRGFLHKNNNWSFRFDNGESFRGIGENVGWEPRTHEQGGYKGAYTYNYILPKLANNGVNYFRTWMSPWNLPLEWKKVDETTKYSNSDEYFNPGAIQRFDQLVDMNDSLGLYMMVAFDYHGALSDKWALNNYNVANGGPLNHPSEFFTNPQAKEMYRNRLRYIVARWGYSTSIGAWEFFNEIDNAVYSESNGGRGDYSHADITAWHDEMSTYLKSIDPYGHLVTTSISHREIEGMDVLPSLDFNQRHVYQDPYVGEMDQTISSKLEQFGKPYVIGEYGFRYQDDNYEAYAWNWDFDFKQGMWLGLLSPTPILPLSWWWEMFDAKAGITKYFRSIKEIHYQMMAAAGNAGNFESIAATTSSSNQKVLAVKGGKKYFVYILNRSDSAVVQSISVPTAADGRFTIKVFDPKEGDNYTYTEKGTIQTQDKKILITGIEIEPFRERILILNEEGNTEGEQLPFASIHSIPGKIEAENFDKGGEGIAYHDLDSINNKEKYRLDEGVDIEESSEGGFNVAAIVTGEWLEYSVEITKTGTYQIQARVAAVDIGKKFHIELDGENISGTLTVPNTGNWQVFQTISVNTPSLTKGVRTLRIVFESSDFNLDYISLILLSEAPVVWLTSPEDGSTYEAPFQGPAGVLIEAEATDHDGGISKVEFYNGNTKIGEDEEAPYSFLFQANAGTYTISAKAIDTTGLESTSDAVNIIVYPSQVQLPYAGVAASLPAKIEAENYDEGAEGVAYHDNDSRNSKGHYRQDGVDIEPAFDKGYNIADVHTGEWLEYTIDVPTDGKYDIYASFAAVASTNKFYVLVDGEDMTGPVDVPYTGGWQDFKVVPVKDIPLKAGQRIIRIKFEGDDFNLNYYELTLAGSENRAPSVLITEPVSGTTFEGGQPIALKADVTDDGSISKVEFFDKGKKIGEDLTAPYEFSWSPSAGEYRIFVKATDNMGATTISTALFLTVTRVVSTVNFQGHLADIGENDGSAKVKLTFDRTTAENEWIKVNVKNGPGAKYGFYEDYSTFPEVQKNALKIEVPKGSSSAEFTVIVNKDIYTKELTELINFSIDSVSAGFTKGPDSLYALNIENERPGAPLVDLFVIYPVPTRGSVTIKYPSEITASSKVILMVSSANMRTHFALTGTPQEVNNQLNQKLNSVERGVYVVKLITSKKVYYSTIIKI